MKNKDYHAKLEVINLDFIDKKIKQEICQWLIEKAKEIKRSQTLIGSYTSKRLNRLERTKAKYAKISTCYFMKR